MKILKQTLFTLSMMVMLLNNVGAVNASFNFVATPIAENVYSIISPSYGLPSPENKGWNSNSHFMVTKNGVLVFDTGSSELIGYEIIKQNQTGTLWSKSYSETSRSLTISRIDLKFRPVVL